MGAYWYGSSGAYWIPPPGGGGVVEKFLRREYTGDGSNNRELDLGDDYDVIQIYATLNYASNASHPIRADCSGTYYSNTAIDYTGGTDRMIDHTIGTPANAYFQGKMFGADKNKIKLGSSGASLLSTNRSMETYVIYAYKFSTVSP